MTRMTPQIQQLLDTMRQVNIDLVAVLNAEWPSGTWIKASSHPNKAPEIFRVIGAHPDRPGYLSAEYQSGHRTLIWCGNVVEPA